jgi:hypothetical protein
MLRSSSSLLGKVLKISLLGKGLCRNKPHLQAETCNKQSHMHLRISMIGEAASHRLLSD